MTILINFALATLQLAYQNVQDQVVKWNLNMSLKCNNVI